MTIQSYLLDSICEHPGTGVPASEVERYTAALRRFVATPQFDDAVLCSNDSGFTRISIVMPSYNQERFIERSILSVLNQNYPNLQFIVMDGGSNDGTLDIIRKYSKYLTWRSEKDRGQSDAINKALKLADGELVGWQNSDDVYFPGALHQIHEMCRKQPSAALYSGSVAQIDETDRVLRAWRFIKPTVRRLLYDDYILSSQGVFLRREVHSRIGEYDPELFSAFDMDLWLKLLTHDRAVFLPAIIGAFRDHAGTKTSSTPERGYAELTVVRKKYGVDDATIGWRLVHRAMVLTRTIRWEMMTKRHCVMVPAEKWSAARRT